MAVTREPRILHATSGSLAARAATVVAAELAAGFEAQLIIVHVIVAENYRVGRMAPTLPITRRLDDAYTDPVLLDARRVAWARGVSTELALIAGDAPAAIVALAHELAPQLIVIGSQRTRIPRLGATTRRWVQSQAPCPVLAVTPNRPPQARRAPEPALAR